MKPELDGLLRRCTRFQNTVFSLFGAVCVLFGLALACGGPFMPAHGAEERRARLLLMGAGAVVFVPAGVGFAGWSRVRTGKVRSLLTRSPGDVVHVRVVKVQRRQLVSFGVWFRTRQGVEVAMNVPTRADVDALLPLLAAHLPGVPIVDAR